MAVINDRFGYLFLATPHTASRAIRDALLTHPGSQETGAHHTTVDELQRRYGLRRLHKFYTFSVIRNPADIMVTKWIDSGGRARFFDFLRNSIQYCSDPANFLFPHKRHSGALIRYENLQMNLDTLFGRLGIPSVQLGVVGETRGKKSWLSYYTFNELNMLATRYPECSEFEYWEEIKKLLVELS